jgi:predicted GNAT family acetyltransferase
MIQDVTDSDLERVRAFLDAHRDSSLFLLSNLALFGPRLGDHPNSGSYRCVVEDGRIVAVFSLTRRGNLLVQGAGRADLAAEILEACDAESIEPTGVIGDWLTAFALWGLVCADPRFEPTQSQKDVLFGLSLAEAADAASPVPSAAVVRQMNADDFEQWQPLNSAYLAELRLPLQLTAEQRREEFEADARAHRWWGAFDHDRLIAVAGLNAAYGPVGQVGGVYCRPEERRKGWSRALMRKLIADSRARYQRLVLFTGEDNVAAQRLYESLDFEISGAFGIFLGVRGGQARAQQSFKWAGRSGEVYTYEIHEWPTRLSSGPGNYIFASSEGGGAWRPILIGECADLSDLASHERRHSGRHDLTHVHVRANFNPVAVRRREAADLAERWTPGQGDTE